MRRSPPGMRRRPRRALFCAALWRSGAKLPRNTVRRSMRAFKPRPWTASPPGVRAAADRRAPAARARPETPGQRARSSPMPRGRSRPMPKAPRRRAPANAIRLSAVLTRPNSAGGKGAPPSKARSASWPAVSRPNAVPGEHRQVGPPGSAPAPPASCRSPRAAAERLDSGARRAPPNTPTASCPAGCPS